MINDMETYFQHENIESVPLGATLLHNKACTRSDEAPPETKPHLLTRWKWQFFRLCRIVGSFLIMLLYLPLLLVKLVVTFPCLCVHNCRRRSCPSHDASDLDLMVNWNENVRKSGLLRADTLASNLEPQPLDTAIDINKMELGNATDSNAYGDPPGKKVAEDVMLAMGDNVEEATKLKFESLMDQTQVTLEGPGSHGYLWTEGILSTPVESSVKAGAAKAAKPKACVTNSGDFMLKQPRDSCRPDPTFVPAPRRNDVALLMDDEEESMGIGMAERFTSFMTILLKPWDLFVSSTNFGLEIFARMVLRVKDLHGKKPILGSEKAKGSSWWKHMVTAVTPMIDLLTRVGSSTTGIFIGNLKKLGMTGTTFGTTIGNATGATTAGMIEDNTGLGFGVDAADTITSLGETDTATGTTEATETTGNEIDTYKDNRTGEWTFVF